MRVRSETDCASAAGSLPRGACHQTLIPTVKGRRQRRDPVLDKPIVDRSCARLFQAESLRKTSDMALKIRLTKVGSVHQPLYRVVVAEARSRRDGAAVENLGTYRPGDKGNPINIDLSRVDYWLSKGATPTDTMHAMIKKARRSSAAKAETATA